MRMVVVLPAPFGPRKPRISPFSTRKEMPSTAVARPYLLVRLSTSIIAIVLPCLGPWTRGLPRRSGRHRFGLARARSGCRRRFGRVGDARPLPQETGPTRHGFRLQPQYHSGGFFQVSIQERMMPVFSLTSRRKATLATLAERVLEAPDLAGLTRLLTVELRQALAAENASLLLWDRRLESFESLALDEAGLDLRFLEVNDLLPA